MKVVIVETVHAQYGLTQSELFHDAEKVFFATQEVSDRMHALAPERCDGRFIIISGVDEACQAIIDHCNMERVDLFSMSPIFTNFESVLRIALDTRATTVITIHNLNYWFNPRFRTWKYYRQRRIKHRITRAFDHILVDEGILAYVKAERPELLRNHSFLQAPFTLFPEQGTPQVERKAEELGRLKVVLPGSIDNGRRNYGPVLEVIDHFAQQHAPIAFSFAGPAVGAFGLNVVKRLEQANSVHGGIAVFLPGGEPLPAEVFQHEMATADLLLSPLNAEFNALGTREFYGKTKVTGASGDLVTFQLPGLLPAHIPVPGGLTGSVFQYSSAHQLYALLQRFMEQPGDLAGAKARAVNNSLHYTAEAVRSGLSPLLNPSKRTKL